MAITRWDPFRDVFTLQTRMNSLLQDYAREGSRQEADTLAAGAFVPPVDIYEDAEKIILTLEVPGIAQDAFDISVENNTLSVRGERQWASEKREENFHRVERRYGSFARAFTLPATVDKESVQASYEAGVLHIELRKKAEAKSRQIKVQLGAPRSTQHGSQPGSQATDSKPVTVNAAASETAGQSRPPAAAANQSAAGV